jgi:hypothetical protein
VGENIFSQGVYCPDPQFCGQVTGYTAQNQATHNQAGKQAAPEYNAGCLKTRDAVDQVFGGKISSKAHADTRQIQEADQNQRFALPFESTQQPKKLPLALLRIIHMELSFDPLQKTHSGSTPG